ncbi:LOW QUALITY PROTEIN: hypothetical protein Cgig2_033866 [Carnegiea gigantea]|uniref:Uncharacterized protein n=1 Tax=Carnegiea gigantea TaxID=171969 RepID=A0A9Q1JXS7_9CARY|nr:LOW QUALITY PROTEIN: hypothetical protein Cgig2_033866 [Carnegiea gigantea]
MLKRPSPMGILYQLHDPNKYYDFHEQTGLNTANYEKDLGVLLGTKQTLGRSTKMKDIPLSHIMGGFAAGITPSLWRKVHLQSIQQVMITWKPTSLKVPTMSFNDRQAQSSQCHYLKYPIDTRTLVDVITWECLKQLRNQEQDLTPFLNPVLGFREQTVHLIGIICLLVQIRDKTKAINIEVDLPVVDVPSAYNAILGYLTLHKVKAVMTPYLLLYKDQKIARECYFVSIKLLIEEHKGMKKATDDPKGKKPKVEQLIRQLVTLAICLIITEDHGRT